MRCSGAPVRSLSRWFLRQACFEAALWPNRHPIAVNLSPLHLSDPELVGTVRQALADSGLAPGRLTLELTESAIIHDRHYALDQLRALKAMGCGLALDDFGVGYSSLDVLRSFSFDRIKLDASFVADVDGDRQAVALLRSVVALGTTLDIPVLAEGVEDPVQLRIAAQEGCSARRHEFDAFHCWQSAWPTAQTLRSAEAIFPLQRPAVLTHSEIALFF